MMRTGRRPYAMPAAAVMRDGNTGDGVNV